MPRTAARPLHHGARMWLDDDDLLRFAVEDVLGVTPERCAAMLERVADKPIEDRPRALARLLLPRAMLSGISSGWSANWVHALPVALLEQRTAMRQKALLRACLLSLSDRTFFSRESWGREVLGLRDAGVGALIAREGLRMSVRVASVQGARIAAATVSRRFAPFVGAAAGGVFNALELTAFATRELSRITPAVAVAPPSGGLEEAVDPKMN